MSDGMNNGTIDTQTRELEQIIAANVAGILEV
jgi:hypothetical protein